MCRGGINDFERFSKLGEKYEAGECSCFNTFKVEGNTYGIEHLKKLARICNPEKLKDLVKTDLYEYFELDYQNTNLIEDTAKFVNYELMKNEDKFQCLLAYLGKGKTTAIKSFLNDYFKDIVNEVKNTKNDDILRSTAKAPKTSKAIIKSKKPVKVVNENVVEQKNRGGILFISPRKSFSNFIEGEFQEFNIENYQKVKNVNECKNLVIQIESLHKLNRNSFDIVILDECESVLKQFSSSTMSKPIDVFNSLQAQLSCAKKVIFADAFFTNRSLNYVKSFDVHLLRIILRQMLEMP